MAKHKPGAVWSFYDGDKGGFEDPGYLANGQVRTDDDQRISVQLVYAPGDGVPGATAVFSLGRADARMLARRINECLDGTRR